MRNPFISVYQWSTEPWRVQWLRSDWSINQSPISFWSHQNIETRGLKYPKVPWCLKGCRRNRVFNDNLPLPGCHTCNQVRFIVATARSYAALPWRLRAWRNASLRGNKRIVVWLNHVFFSTPLLCADMGCSWSTNIQPLTREDVNGEQVRSVTDPATFSQTSS